MRSRRLWCVVWLIAAAVLLPGSATTAQSADPRVSKIRARLERMDIKVLDVGFAPAKGSAPPVWVVLTAASYAQPSWGRVADRTSTVWNVMFAALNTEPPNTLFTVGQDWGKFRLMMSNPLRRITEFDASVRAAKSDAEGQKAVQELWRGVVFRVFDLQGQKRIDEKEFVSKYFIPD